MRTRFEAPTTQASDHKAGALLRPRRRIADGWTKGPRNDDLKQHPCLVPYEELSEEEKDYDRRTSAETLKFIIAQGYSIVK
jgi:ryanodine receptor 2